MAQRKMVDLKIEETSGVDHPAHLHEGWLVMKSASPAQVWQALGSPGQDKETGMDLEKALQRLAEVEAENATLRKAAEGATDQGSGDDVLKSLPEEARAYLEQVQKSADEALAKAAETEATLAKEREQRADEKAVALVKSWEHLSLDADEVGPALRKMRDIDPTLADAVEKALSGADAVSESASIFKEMGAVGHGTETSAYDRLSKMAEADVEKNGGTFAEAFTKAVSANPSLYAEYQAEKKG